MKETLVLIPGLLCDARVWRDQCLALEDRVDLAVADVTADDTIDVMAERILQEAPPYFAVAGHSLGGRVALEVYVQAPERVIKLGLLSTGRRAAQPGEPARRQALLDAARTEGVAAIADRMLIPAMHPEKQRDEGLIADLRAMLERAGPDVLKRQFSAMLNRPDMTALLPNITCPTLVACGREDPYSPLDRHIYMAEHIPNATLKVIEGAGHMAPMEEPDQVTAAIEEWLGL